MINNKEYKNVSETKTIEIFKNKKQLFKNIILIKRLVGDNSPNNLSITNMYKKTNYINVLKQKPLQEWIINTSHYKINEFNKYILVEEEDEQTIKAPNIKTAYQILLEQEKEEKGDKKESDRTKPN